MKPIGLSPVLIDQVYDRLVEAIAAGALAPGQRIRQEALAEMLGVSRQPVSHALQLLKRQRLVEEHGRRGLVISSLDPERLRGLYEVRAALDALAARQAAEQIARGSAAAGTRQAAEDALAAGRALGPLAAKADFIQADVAFHTALYRLAGNPSIEETVAPQWAHLKRSMGVVLDGGNRHTAIWLEHAGILERVLAGDPAGAESAARAHALDAGATTARQLARQVGSAAAA